MAPSWRPRAMCGPRWGPLGVSDRQLPGAAERLSDRAAVRPGGRAAGRRMAGGPRRWRRPDRAVSGNRAHGRWQAGPSGGDGLGRLTTDGRRLTAVGGRSGKKPTCCAERNTSTPRGPRCPRREVWMRTLPSGRNLLHTLWSAMARSAKSGRPYGHAGRVGLQRLASGPTADVDPCRAGRDGGRRLARSCPGAAGVAGGHVAARGVAGGHVAARGVAGGHTVARGVAGGHLAATSGRPASRRAKSSRPPVSPTGQPGTSSSSAGRLE
jgi:hypothetical protein